MEDTALRVCENCDRRYRWSAGGRDYCGECDGAMAAALADRASTRLVPAYAHALPGGDLCCRRCGTVVSRVLVLNAPADWFADGHCFDCRERAHAILPEDYALEGAIQQLTYDLIRPAPPSGDDAVRASQEAIRALFRGYRRALLDAETEARALARVAFRLAPGTLDRLAYRLGRAARGESRAWQDEEGGDA